MPIISKKSLLKKTFENYDEKGAFKEAIIFHESTKYSYEKSKDDFSHITEIRSNPLYLKNMSCHYKEYYGVPVFSLPSIKEIIKNSSNYSIEEIITKRRSSRDFNGVPIPFYSFAKLLLLAYGITGEFTSDDINDVLLLRAAPSAGALYPLEIYSIVFSVESLDNGIYHFNVKQNCIEQIRKGDFQQECYEFCNSQEFIKKASVVFLITGIIERTLNKYRNRGLRFIYFDAGHIVENMYLTATSENINACALGGVFDYEAEKFLQIDGFNESFIYAFAVGK